MSEEPIKHISVKCMCLVEHNGKLLVNKGYDKVKKEIFHRLIGGKVEFGEKCVDTIRREIKEELNAEISDLTFITAIEQIFTYEGEKGHEAIFLYTGKISDKKILESEIIPNPDSEDFPAVWLPIAQVLKGKAILYPTFEHKKILTDLMNGGEVSQA